jgi:hypothetical protein
LPSAVPLPRGPSVLLLGSAVGLLAVAGCPACRYTAESSDAYLTWFAMEGHADPDVLQQVCASRGMCARHSRRLFAQPGAPARLTAIYRYVVAAAARDPGAQPAACLACDQEAGAEDRVLSALLDEFTTGCRAEYKEHGGLCLPHLRRAVRRASGTDVRWLIRFMIARLGASQPDVGLLAGGPDADADERARLRAATPRRPHPGTCPACWSAADCERRQLAGLAAAGSDGGAPPAGLLCARHLRDAASAAEVLAWQAGQASEGLADVLGSKPRLLGIAPGWLSSRARRAVADPDCPVCRGSKLAASEQLGRLAAAVRRHGPAGARDAAPCVRHAASLRATDAAAGRLVADLLGETGRVLVQQLDAACSQPAATGRLPELPRDVGAQRRPGPAGAGAHETAAWRRAAAFLDGSVFGACAVEA